LNGAALERTLARQLQDARRFFEQALASLPEERWGERPNGAYSPVGWHAGHVAAIQARFLLGEDRWPLFDPFRTDKDERTALPPPPELRRWLAEVAARVEQCDDFPRIDGLPADFLVRHVAQHELQHAEHVQVIAALCEGRLHRMAPPLPLRSAGRLERGCAIVWIGSADAAEAYDNERRRYAVLLAPHWLDRAPVSVAEFREFVDAGGYRDESCWTREGWAWVQRSGARAPLGFDAQHPQAPVSCVSWFEADAYARARSARLPTEAELESAQLAPLGVWEWTSSWFEPYPGFRPYPYDGYSTPWFNGTHRVLRGASWATAERLRRPTFRNWYEPGFREIPAGFRCAGDL
jgi:iron(II)-dependent oxidoreductase